VRRINAVRSAAACEPSRAQAASIIDHNRSSAALDQLTAAGTFDCPDCPTLQVTGARLTTTSIQTTRGPATASAWEYSLKGTAVRATRVAVAGSAIVRATPPSWDPDNPPGGLAIESATTTTLGTRLTVTFTGSPGPASRPCGADYRAEAVESANAVVVIVIEHRHAADEDCPAIGAPGPPPSTWLNHSASVRSSRCSKACRSH
jgi:hypothetical protein